MIITVYKWIEMEWEYKHEQSGKPKTHPLQFFVRQMGDLLGSPRHPDGSLHVAELDTFLNLSF